ncbi:hypothetical protein MMC34_001082 [Xylographa carneopallida]|nr:hypothetical protein [Xylographa carneopallida]
MDAGSGGDGYAYLTHTATKFPEDNRARTALLAQQGYARIAAENAAKAEAKAERERARTERSKSGWVKSGGVENRGVESGGMRSGRAGDGGSFTAGEGGSTRELLGGGGGVEGVRGKEKGRKRGLLARWWKRGQGEGEGEVVR